MSSLIHQTAVVDEGAKIGSGTKIWHWTHVSSGAEIGENCSLGQNVFVANKTKIGNNVKIQNNVSVYEQVELEDDVFCGPSMVFTNVINPRSAISRKTEYKTTLVKKGATIGANATILCGVEVGQFAFIAAGAVVRENVPAYALIAGVPGKIKGWMGEFGIQLVPLEGDIFVCPETKKKYLVKNNLCVPWEES